MSSYSSALAEFLKNSEETQESFAQKIGCTQVAVSRYANGTRFPDGSTAQRIDDHSFGAVSFDRWKEEMLRRQGVPCDPAEAA
jgi:transcriptional regulator with XRE-family HTH domain